MEENLKNIIEIANDLKGCRTADMIVYGTNKIESLVVSCLEILNKQGE